MPKRLDPKLDLVFKLLFGGPNSQEILISLLTAVIRPPVPIKSVTVLNPEIPGELVTARGIRLDVHVLLQDGRHVDVEMQSKSRGGIRKRALFYWSRLYDTQLRRGGWSCRRSARRSEGSRGVGASGFGGPRPRRS
jgi:predicted transposase/invertase (TIGR01784 family)